MEKGVYVMVRKLINYFIYLISSYLKQRVGFSLQVSFNGYNQLANDKLLLLFVLIKFSGINRSDLVTTIFFDNKILL